MGLGRLRSTGIELRPLLVRRVRSRSGVSRRGCTCQPGADFGPREGDRRSAAVGGAVTPVRLTPVGKLAVARRLAAERLS